MTSLIWIAFITILLLLSAAGLLHLLPRCGVWGRRCSEAFCRAPLVDLVLFAFTTAPFIVGGGLAGWRGVLAAIAGQLAALWIWIILHELTHPRARRGPRIYRTLDRIVGSWRNHLAVWITAIVVPIFWPIRLAQVLFYPCLVFLVHFPRLRQSEWVCFSRQKFNGLVGYDLLWCLYCDWMTGVWSLGSEMLRNVESFWCPIRFYEGKKCENCKVDFPDIADGWVSADGTMAQVTAVLEREHNKTESGWFNRPTRLTVRGRERETLVPQESGPPPTA